MSRIGAALAVALVAAAAPLQGQDWRTTTAARQYTGQEKLRVELEYGVGSLKVQPGDPGSLYRATMRYDSDAFSPEMRYRDGQLRVGISGENVKIRKGERRGNQLDLALSPRAALDVDLKFGAVEARLELGGLRITDASIATGASDTELRFSRPNAAECQALRLQVGAAEFKAYGIGNLSPRRIKVEGGVGDLHLDFSGKWRNDVTGEIGVGMGAVTLAVPRGVGVRLVKRSVLASFDPEGLVKRGNTYYSVGYESSSRKISLDVTAALGSIEVHWLGDDTASAF